MTQYDLLTRVMIRESEEQRRSARRAIRLEQDVKHLVPIARRLAQKATRSGGTITTDNVKRAASHLLLAYSDRQYLSAVFGQTMLRAKLKAAGWERTTRVGNKGGGVVRKWRAA